MAIGLIIIEKELNGETWGNTHAFDTGTGDILDGEDMIEIGMDSVQTGAPEFLGGAGHDAATAKFVPALLSFERQMHFSPVNFLRIYVTDGKINNILDPNAFAVAPLNVPGLSTTFGEDPQVLMPGNVTLQINRVPAGFSARQGRMFLRGVLVDTDVRFAGKGGVAYTNGNIAAQFVTRVAAALTTSGLGRFMGAGASGVIYSIPRYVVTPLLGVQRKGQLDSTVPIAALSVSGPVSRQMKRGKKKAA